MNEHGIEYDNLEIEGPDTQRAEKAQTGRQDGRYKNVI
jgi:hypothetical protein